MLSFAGCRILQGISTRALVQAGQSSSAALSVASAANRMQRSISRLTQHTQYGGICSYEQIQRREHGRACAASSILVQYRNLQQYATREEADEDIRRLRYAADENRDDASKQERLLEVLAIDNPTAALRRYESGEYAANEACTKHYIRALVNADRLNQTNLSTILPGGRDGAAAPMRTPAGFSGMRPATATQQGGGGGQQRGAFGGGDDATAPLYVAIQEPSARAQFWKFIRSIITLLIVLAAVNQIMDERGLGGKGPMGHQEIAPEKDAHHVVTFDDVQGADEAKEELQEVVAFLRNPDEFTRLGGKLPKGVLLTGPPGTGKTLLAKAVAGEAGVPFFYASGSEFDEMFVGVGARRVRELFAAAKKKSPCIVFMDEIDAVGGKRSAKDQQFVKMTLNQLLVELDGFQQQDAVIVIAATNFPEMLDSALIRPGRFDTQVKVPLPDIRGRHAILKVHAKDVPVDSDGDLWQIARGTPGFSGAELANIVNQAALRASVQHRDTVDLATLEWAKDKIMMGPERRNAVITPQDLKVTAYHEGGHALCALYTDGAIPIYKATIVPRGNALGLVMQLPEDDTNSVSEKELLARLVVCMGGRAAEERILGKENTTSGASSDLEQATRIARAMVTKYGFSDKIGPISVEPEEMSGKLSEMVDSEVKRLCQEALAKAHSLLSHYDREHHRLADALVEYETLTEEEIRRVVRGERLTRAL
eukprot:m.98077 g.98077  ORF g.98077 m.98077 type:complete len:710 (+) comp16738_c0_seq2:201-2330(+)